MAEPKQDCACHNKNCSRHGNCLACQVHHRSRGDLTRCQQKSRKANPKSAL